MFLRSSCWAVAANDIGMPETNELNIVVLSTSLSAASRSSLLARSAFARAGRLDGVAADMLDLRDFDLPMCDAGPAYEHADVTRLRDRLDRADAIVVALAVYNYSESASAKNLVELTGPAWTGKTVSFLAAAGGRSSYMSVMHLANCLMLDFRSFIVPRFVYAVGEAFSGNELTDPDIRERTGELVNETVRVARALRFSDDTGRGRAR